MSMDNNGLPHSGVNNGLRDSDDSLNDGTAFAATPIWERRGKKKGFGRSRPAAAAAPAPIADEPRTFEPDPLTRPAAGPNPLDAPLVMGSATADIAAGETRPRHLHGEDELRHDLHRHDASLHHDEHLHRDDDRIVDHDAPLAAPIGRPRTTTTTTRAVKKSGPPAAAIALGVLALGGLGVAGLYTMNGDDGVPELTPGVEGSAPVAAAPPMTDGAAVASRTTAPAVAEAPRAPVVATTERRTASVTRTRPTSRASSASSAGVPASATAALPSGPQPYSAANPDAPAATPPTEATAPPAVQTPAPAEIPATPPVSPDPAPAPSSASPESPAPDSPAETPPQA